MSWGLLINSLLVSGFTTVMAVMLGGCAAVALIGLPRRWQRRGLVLSLTAVALPPFLLVNAWLDLLGTQGLWRDWLPLDIYSLGGAVWVLTLWTWPLATVLIWSAWQRLEPEHLEIEPALTGWRLGWWVLLPMTRLVAAQAAILIFVLALNNFAVPTILQIKVYPAELWLRLNTGLDVAGAWAVSWPMVAAPLLMLAWLRRRPIAWPQASRPASGSLVRRQLGAGWHTVAVIVAAVLWWLSAGLALGELIFSKQTWQQLPSAISASADVIGNSAWYAALAATGVVGLALAHRRVRSGSAWWVFFFVPGVLLGQALAWASNRPGLDWLYASGAWVILALLIRYLALPRQAVGQAARTVDPLLVDAARLDGARGWRLWRLVYWPRMAPAAIAAWYVVYLLCLWDVETLLMIYPPGGETLALRVFNLLHYGHNVQVDALCLVLIGLAVLPAALAMSGRWVLMRSRGILAACGGTLLRFAGRGTAGWTMLAITALGGGVALFGAGCDRGPGDGRLDWQHGRVQSTWFDHVEVIGQRGTGSGEFIKPRSVAVDSEDNLYVVDMTGRVQKFSPRGEYLTSWQFAEIERGKPKGMCWHAQANQLIVVEPHYARINHFTADGVRVSRWGEHGTEPGQLWFPRAVAVDDRGRMFISEYTRVERIQCFTADHQFVFAFGKAGTGQGEFNRPEGLGWDGQGHLYVADSCNHRIQVFTPDGRWVTSFGAPGRGPGQFSFPYDVQVDAAGYQFVCEFGNSRIQVFNPAHQPVEQLGGPGFRPGQFKNPWSIAFDSQGNLYVADSANHRVQKFVRKQPLPSRRSSAHPGPRTPHSRDSAARLGLGRIAS